jgi:hypothetical protein
MDESDFMKQFSGSATANLAFGALFMLYMGIKKLCNRPSKCKSHIHCCCLDLDVKDQTIREQPEVSIEVSPRTEL